MALDLEVVGEVEELPPDAVVERPVAVIKRLRDSHHSAAKLLARGMAPHQVSLQTGYSPSRLSILQADPSFQELTAYYRQNNDVVAAEVESMFLGIARDFAQELHERVLDNPENFTPSELTENFKVFADRAGFAPISRSVNKNLNLNIGDRMDAIPARKKDAA